MLIYFVYVIFIFIKFDQPRVIQAPRKTLIQAINNKDATVSNTTYGNSDKISYTYSPEKYLTSQSFNDTEQYKWDYNAAGEVYKYTDKLNGLYSVYDYDTMKRISMKTTFLSNNSRQYIIEII